MSCLDENKKSGYVKLFRSLPDWEWFQDRNTLQVYIYCLSQANYKDKNYMGQLIKRGSFVSSIGKISEKCKLTPKQVRTALDHLKKSDNVATIFNGKGLIISIKNYDEYQDEGNQRAGIGQAEGNQRATTKNIKNIRSKEVVGVVDTPPTYTPHFVRFYEAYPRKGYKKDTFEYWRDNGLEDMDIDTLVKACERYEKAMDSKVDAMVYPRTFLMDDIYQTYMRKSVEELEREERLREHEEQVKKFKELGIKN